MLPRLVLIAAAVASLTCASPGGSGPTPAPAVCGDARVSGGEECDDGNTDDADACLRTCETPAVFVASDPHIHSVGCGGDVGSGTLQNISTGRGVEVTVPLVWGDGYDKDRRRFTGQDDPTSRPGAIVHYELEVSHFPAAQTGHLLLYGLRSIDFSSSVFRFPQSGIPVADFALGQGPQVVAGMAHGQFWPLGGRFPDFPETCCMPYDFLPQALRGKLTFLESEQRDGRPTLDAATAFLHRKLLNSGGRAALAGGSDFPCINHVANADTLRTDVLFDGQAEVTYDSWRAAFQRGRTTLASGAGTRLNMRVNGRRMSEEVRLRAGQAVRVTVESRQPLAANLQVFANGAVVAGARLDAGAQAAEFMLQADRSMWLSAVTEYAATSPIYVLVDEAPILGPPEDICYVRRYLDHLIRGVERRHLDLGAETEDAIQVYAEVRALVEQRFRDAGGTVCQ
jgi:cysteine-rich repeat protein